VVDVQKMLGFLRSGEPFPELEEVVAFIPRHFPFGSYDTTVLKPGQRALVPENCTGLRLCLTDCRLFAQPTEKAAEESESSSTRAETEPAPEEPAAEPAAAEPAAEEPAAEEAVEPAAAEPAAEEAEPAASTVRLFGEKGFDVHMGGEPFARVLGDLYRAGKVMENLDFKVQLELYNDSRKKGEPVVVDTIPRMVQDRKAFDVGGIIARVSWVSMLVPAPSQINGFWGYWDDGRREIVSNFHELLAADNPPYGPETVFTVGGELYGIQGYDPSTQTVRTDDGRE
ncbi:unnamed protein product, partial [Symbiodinium sp. CCMP2456]